MYLLHCGRHGMELSPLRCRPQYVINKGLALCALGKSRERHGQPKAPLRPPLANDSWQTSRAQCPQLRCKIPSRAISHSSRRRVAQKACPVIGYCTIRSRAHDLRDASSRSRYPLPLSCWPRIGASLSMQSSGHAATGNRVHIAFSAAFSC